MGDPWRGKRRQGTEVSREFLGHNIGLTHTKREREGEGVGGKDGRKRVGRLGGNSHWNSTKKISSRSLRRPRAIITH